MSGGAADPGGKGSLPDTVSGPSARSPAHELEAEEAELPDKLFFRIGEAAQLVGVEPHVLRYWESEFRMRPQRSTAGQRMYRRKDIAKFLRIRKLLHDEGFTIAGARKALSDTGADPTGPSVDTGRIAEAAGRIGELRERIASLRARWSRLGTGSGD